MPETSRPTDDPIDLATSDLTTFATEWQRDDRTLGRAVAVAAAFHLALLAIHLPELAEPAHAAEPERKVFVVETVRFKEPVKPQDRIPEERTRIQPVPDPTPDEPEVIRDLAEEMPVLDVADLDLATGIPDEPPPVIEDAPIVVAGDVVPPVRIHDPRPTYTEMARRARLEGVVIVQAIIDKDGAVSNVKLLRGLGLGLDESTIDAVKGWRFEPATLGGRPVSVYYTLTVHFGVS